MKLLFLGGSFNPVHWGHLVLAEEIRDEFGYDKVLLVPAACSPHKEYFDDPGSELRLEMLELATAGNQDFVVDDCELRRSGYSYTIETISELSSRYIFEGKLGLVIGDDLVVGYPRWRDPAALALSADLIVARRTGIDFQLPYPHRRASNRIIALSSSDIRARVASGKSIRYLVPEPVRAYIAERSLYGTH